MLEAHAMARDAAPPPAPTVPKLKAPTPETFKYPARDVNVSAWHFALDNYFILQPACTDASKIIYAGTLMRNGAAAWYRNTYPDPTRITDTWADFKARMHAEFQVISPVREARDRLAACRQTGSVAAYISAFRSIAVEIPDLSAAEKFDRFVRGLKPAIQREVDMRAVTDFDTAATVAERYDAHTYRAEVRTNRFQYRPAGYAQGSSAGPQPMELGVMHGQVRPSPLPGFSGSLRDTPGLREKLDAAGLCFYCRASKDHRVNDCPWKKLDDSKKPSGRSDHGRSRQPMSKNR